MRNPPILVSVIGFFALLAGFGYLFFGLRVLGFDWFGLFGDIEEYESIGLWGWFAILAAVAWIMVAFGLWALQPWARTAAMIVAAFSLFEAALAFIQFPGSGLGFGMALMPAVILWYFSSDEIKEAFGETETPAAPMSDNL
jgi:hypothetical protein